jgi:hypothetical protein
MNLMPQMPGLRYVRGNEICFGGHRTQVDGDPGSSGPTTISNAAAPIRVVVS